MSKLVDKASPPPPICWLSAATEVGPSPRPNPIDTHKDKAA
ncbi:MAG: hypothetical protein RL342_2168, partial [Pseudomonadota bacterium]